MLKSTQTNKYATAAFIQESPTDLDVNFLKPGDVKIKKDIYGNPFCIFWGTMQTYNEYNRMKRWYSMSNMQQVVDTDDRIITLESQRKLRGELNHPNPDIEGTKLTSIRMTIPSPQSSSHFIMHHKFVDNKFMGEIETNSGCADGRQVTIETVSHGCVPSFSVRVCGNMIPNASYNQPNITVTKFITTDWVDYPSHIHADGDIQRFVESYVESHSKFLHELAKYCTEKDENLRVVCESFEISPEELFGISEDGCLQVACKDQSKILIPLASDIRKEAMSILTGRS